MDLDDPSVVRSVRFEEIQSIEVGTGPSFLCELLGPQADAGVGKTYISVRVDGCFPFISVRAGCRRRHRRKIFVVYKMMC